ncbi:M48 family metallopeptidase [Fibrobacter sp.]|uniref:M48 family metallopeptidase n=1 Tax=Fibrobacter sp. TaxID=35828 RepID=UPI0038668F42
MEYTIKYSKRRKTLNITVERNRSVVVTAPEGTNEEKIKAVVESKRKWIEEKISSSQKWDEENAKEFVSGESILYLGKFYFLKIDDAKIETLNFDDCFHIAKNNFANAKEIFKQWFVKRAEEYITPLAKSCAENLGVVYKQCKIVDNMEYRWGSCTPKGNICFNWRIIKAPMNVVRYVVLHELAHRLEYNHTDRFWNIVSVQQPDYLTAKEWLKENGGLLERDF